MVAAMLTELGAAEDGLLTLLDNPAVVEVDAHNAVRGCLPRGRGGFDHERYR